MEKNINIKNENDGVKVTISIYTGMKSFTKTL